MSINFVWMRNRHSHSILHKYLQKTLPELWLSVCILFQWSSFYICGWWKKLCPLIFDSWCILLHLIRWFTHRVMPQLSLLRCPLNTWHSRSFYAFQNNDAFRCGASDGQGLGNVFLSGIFRLEQSRGKNTFQNNFFSRFAKSLFESENLSLKLGFVFTFVFQRSFKCLCDISVSAMLVNTLMKPFCCIWTTIS